jgi:hypothetical protein
MTASLYPLFLSLQGRSCVVGGGNEIAVQRTVVLYVGILLTEIEVVEARTQS